MNRSGRTSWGGNGLTPLMAAAGDGDEDLLRGLLRVGADMEARDSFGGTALTYAAAKGRVGCVAALLDAGADPDVRVSGKVSVLHMACLRFLPKRESLMIARLLIEARAIVDGPDDDGSTPLMMAAESGNAKLVELLIVAGADPARRDHLGLDSYGLAAGPGVLKAIAAALSKRAKPKG